MQTELPTSVAALEIPAEPRDSFKIICRHSVPLRKKTSSRRRRASFPPLRNDFSHPVQGHKKEKNRGINEIRIVGSFDCMRDNSQLDRAEQIQRVKLYLEEPFATL